ncbi:MAG: hypothetical protein M3537_02855 [Chloroflexota bacterium]|nr:hypothetical protein [Chloroflexota bacterium]
MSSGTAKPLSNGRRARLATAGSFSLLVLAALLVLLARGGPEAPAQALDPADLSIQKFDSPDPVSPGGTLTYTIFVTNAGPDPATNVVVTDDLPKQVDFVSATASPGSCERKGSRVECSIGTLAFPPPLSPIAPTVTITVTVKNNVKEAAISNTASVTSDVTDPQPSNNSDTETTSVSQAPGLTCLGKKPTLVGTVANDTLTGTDKNDVILALAGRDQVFGLGGRDLICGRGGADVVDAGSRPDAVSGGRGRDLLIGRGGGDELRGRAGRDRLRGNAGNDLLRGGRNIDRCRGGPGSDTVLGCER